jgi:catechol 2,3-dioxygenase-like lactoylglutathione lyase family enzyme
MTSAKEAVMFENTRAFSGFSVDDVPEARKFYGETLGLRVSEESGMLSLHIAGERDILVYPKLYLRRLVTQGGGPGAPDERDLGDVSSIVAAL